MKPSWEDAPEWAQYLVMDEDGLWWWYEYEPSLCCCQQECSQWTIKSGEVELAYDSNEHWQETLEKRP